MTIMEVFSASLYIHSFLNIYSNVSKSIESVYCNHMFSCLSCDMAPKLLNLIFETIQ